MRSIPSYDQPALKVAKHLERSVYILEYNFILLLTNVNDICEGETVTLFKGLFI